MTEIPDLYDEPSERLEYVFQNFVKKLERHHALREEQLDRRFLSYRSKLYNLHKKTVTVYKEVFDDMLTRLLRDRDAKDVMMFESYIRSSKPEMYSRVFQQILPALRRAEENKTDVQIEVKEIGHNASMSSGSCLFSSSSDDYFSFWEEFFDTDSKGDYDWGVEYSIVKRAKGSDRQEKELSETREKEYMARVMEDHYGEKVPTTDAILKEVFATEDNNLTTIQDGLSSKDPAK